MTIKHLPYIKTNFQKSLVIPKDAQHFFNEDESKLNRYTKNNFWVGDKITEYGYEQLYINDWVEENTNYKRLSINDNTKYQYILVDKQVLHNLVFSWPSYFRISDEDYCSCIFSSKTGIEVYDKIVEQENCISIKVDNIPWFDGKTHKIFNTIPSKFMYVRLKKKNNQIYWERVSRLNEITFNEII